MIVKSLGLLLTGVLIEADQSTLTEQLTFHLFLWPGGFIVVPQISGFCCGIDIFVRCVDLCTYFRSTQSSRVRPSLSSPSLFPSLPSFPPFACSPCPSTSLYFIFSNPFFCPHPPLFSPSFPISLLSSPPLPGAMWHTQGMMRMMMVQMMMKLTLSKFCSQSYSQKPPPPCLILPPILPSFWK